MRDSQKGMALITVILLLLVLTVLAMTAAVMMTQEDRTSSRADLQKAAFYVAEAGLRRGEDALRLAPLVNGTDLLGHPSVSTVDGLDSDRVRHPYGGVLESWDGNHLGTFLVDVANCADLSADEACGELANQEIPLAIVGADVGRAARYSLLVRNNPEDSRPPTGTPTTNTDTRLRLISVGVIYGSTGQTLAMKILEEEYNYAGVTQAPSTQKLSDAGGTSSGLYGG
jgi:hypothetical protein